MELIMVKLLVMTLSGLVRVFFGMFPLVVIKTVMKTWSKATDDRIKKVISILMFFGGGVLLATCFLHMMPEVRESFAQADPNLPVSEVIFLAGFFLVYLIEDVVHSIVHQKKQQHQAERHMKEEGRQLGRAIHERASFRNMMRNHSGRTQSTGDNGNKTGLERLHNNDEATNTTTTIEPSIAISSTDDNNSTASTSTATSTTTSSTADGSEARRSSGNTLMVGDADANGTISCCNSSGSQQKTLSLSTGKNEECNPNPNGLKLRQTKEIFGRGMTEEIPGLPSKVTNGNGGIANLAFVPDINNTKSKEQLCDPDWWKDISTVVSKPNSQLHLLPPPNCLVPSCNIQDKCCGHISGNLQSNNNFSDKNGGLQLPVNANRRPSESSQHSHGQHSQQGHSHLPGNNLDDDSIGGEIRNLLIVIAISFHGIFEGMAIGLQSTEIDVWYLFLAVSLHECTILFCIGVELISSKTRVFRMILYILVVSLVSPVGIAIGIVVSEKSFGDLIHKALIVGCFQGLAAGTLLYVTFFEIFQEEGRKLHRKCYHILVAVLGFLLMGSLEFMGGHEHGGGHSHGGINESSSLNSTTHQDNDDHSHHHPTDGHDDHHHHH